jgi:glycosyltransferase involved in cell wall biosynthesis
MILGVVITSYNDEDTLIEAIKSAVRLKKKNIFIVVVDDCSTDSTIKIIKHAKKTNQIDVAHFNKENRGVSCSRNTGIKLCRHTDYITFVDADDILLPSLSRILNKKKLFGDLIAFNFNYKFNNRVVKSGPGFYKSDRKLEVKDVQKYLYKYLIKPNKYSMYTTCWAKLYKTKLLQQKKNLYFNEKLFLCEDTDFVFRFLTSSKSIQFINQSIYCHKLGDAKENLKKLTFGIGLKTKNQISFLTAVDSCKNYFIKNGHTREQIQKKLDQCIGSYTIIYIVRSCLRINSLPSFISTYLFWKNIFNRNILSSKMVNYSFKDAGGNWLLPFLIRKKLYFVAIFVAYYICKKRYL